MSEANEDRKQVTLGIAQVTESQRDLANQSQLEFYNKNYVSCCAVLNKLSTQRSSDPHVLHNKAVAEFYQSDCRRTENLRRNLSHICHMCHMTPEMAGQLEDVDQASVYYNQAIVLFHLHRYSAALAITDSLFQVVETMDEELAKKVMFLLVELYTTTHQPEKAMGVLVYVEKSLQGTRGDGAEKMEGEVRDEGSLSATWKCRISQYKLRCYMMIKSFKFCKREIKSLTTTANPRSAVLFGYLKSNFEYLRGNWRKAIKALTSMPQTPPVTRDNGQCLPVMYYNNLSCVHFVLGKHHLATFYLKRAVAENEKGLAEVTRDPQGCQLHKLGVSRHVELAYNMGVELLHCNRPLVAFDCLIEAAQVYGSNPRLWLRLAECCIMAQRSNNEVDSSLKARQGVIQGSVGSGVHRKLILGTGCSQRDNVSQSPAIPAATLEFAALCLRNALMLLPDSNKTEPTDEGGTGNKAEIKLVRASPSHPMRVAEVTNLRSSILCSCAYVSLCLHDHVMALSYTTRLLAQPALSHAHRYLGHMYMAEALVAVERISEAIDHLDPQAVTDVSVVPPQLKSEQDKGEKSDKDGNDGSVESNGGVMQAWYPRDVTKARALMQYNLAATYALRGDFQKAIQNVGESAKVMGSPMPAQMYYMRLYLDLIEGRRKMAQMIIKDHFGHTTPNRVDGQETNMESVLTAR